MVLESAVASILNKYLGKYIEKLDSKNLSLGIWSGDAILQDLELKKDALSELNLPIEVNWGYVGKLTLNIPWSSLYTKPVIVKLEDVYILAGPTAEKPYDEEKEKGFATKAKRQQLKQIEKAKRKRNNEPKAVDKAGNDSFIEKLTAQIIKNIQVTIQNVHIRYEDKITQPKSPFAAGITLASLSAETTDKFWKPKVVDASAKKIHKLLDLERLSVYWNTGQRGGVLFNGLPNLKNLMKNSIQTSDVSCHEYILEPLSAVAQASIDQSSNVVENIPKVLVSVIQNALDVSLSIRQFKGIMNTIDSFRMMIVNQPYRQYKPLKSPLEDPKSWWVYGFTCIAETTLRPWSWQRIREHRIIYKEYKNLFRKRLLKRWRNVSDTSKLDAKIRALEEKLDIPNILIARQQAENEYVQHINDADDNSEDSDEDENSIEEKDSGWWNWLGFGSKAGENDSDKEEDDDQELLAKFSLSALSDEEKAKLYDAIGYSEEVGNPVYPREYVKYKIDFALNSCRVDLRSHSGREILTLSLSQLLLAFSERPGSNGFSVETSVTNLNVIGSADITSISSANIQDRPCIIKTSESEKDEESKYRLLHFSFSTNPLDVTADYCVIFKLNPLVAIYNMQTVKSLQSFFEMPETEAMIELEEAASARMTELTEATRSGVEYAVMHNRSTYINGEIKSPHLIVPHNEIFEGISKTDKILAIDLGDLKVVTDLNTELQDQLLKEATESDLEAMFYNRSTILLSNTSVAIRTEANISSEEKSTDYILPPTTIELQLFRSLKRGYANFPDFKVLSEVKILSLNLSEDKVEELIKVISYLGTWQHTQITSQENTLSLSTVSKGSRALSTTLSMTELKNLKLRLAESSKGIASPPRARSPGVGSDALSDENPWFDAEEDFVDEGPKPESNLQPSELYASEMSLYDRTKVSCKLRLGQLSVNYMTVEDGKEQLYLWLNIQSCSINIDVHLWDLAVDFRIGGMILKDLIYKGALECDERRENVSRGDFEGNALMIIDSPSDNDLIAVSYVMADSKGPEFQSKFSQTEQSINVDLAKIVMYGKEDSLVSLSGVVSRISTMLSDNIIAAPAQKPKRSLVAIQEESERDTKNSNDWDADEELPTVTKLMVEIHVVIDDLTAFLSNNTSPVMKGSIMGLDFKFSQSSQKTEIVARQKIVQITDLLQEGLETKILSAASSDEDVLFVKIAMFSSSRRISLGGSMLPDINKKDMDIVVRLSKLQIVFLYGLIDASKDILFAMTEDNTRIQAQQKAAITVQNQVTSLHQQSQRIALSINIDAPAIFVPVKRGTEDGFSIDLGHLCIENSFKFKDTSNDDETVVIDSIQLSLQDFIFYSSMSERYAKIIRPTAINVKVRVDRSLCLWCKSIPTVEVHADIPEFKIGLDRKDISMFFEMLAKNIGERSERTVSITFEGANVTSIEEKIESASEVSLTTAESTLDIIEDHKEPAPEVSAVIAKCTVAVDKVMLVLCEDLEDPHIYLSFQAECMNTFVEVASTQTKISSTLESVALKDHSCKDTPLYILASPVGKDLITLSLTIDQVLDPITKVAISSQIFDVSSSGLHVNIEMKSVVKLASFLQDVADEASKLIIKASEEQIISPSDNKEASQEAISVFTVTAAMEQLAVTFLDNEESVASAAVEGLAAHVHIDQEKTLVKCRLKTVLVDDLRKGSLYPKIITVEDDNMLLIEYSMFSKWDKKVEDSDHTGAITEDGNLRVLIGRVKAVFIYKFIMDIINFFDPLMKVFGTQTKQQQSEVTKQISQLNANTAVHYAQSLFKLILDMNIHAPLILVPKTSKSCDLVMIDMGTLRISNHFDTYTIPGESTTNIIHVKDSIKAVLTSAMVTRGKLDATSHNIQEVPVVDNVDVAATIDRYLHPTDPEIKIITELPEVQVSLTESDLNLLSFVFPVNMAEGQQTEIVPSSDLVVPVDVVPVAMVNDVFESADSTSGPTSTTDGEGPAMKTSVSLICNSAKVFVIRDGVNEREKLRDHSKPLCSLSTENISVKVKIDTDSTISVDLALQSLTGDDIRPCNESFYKKVIGQSSAFMTDNLEQGRKDLVTATYKGLPTGEQTVDLVIQRAAVFLNLEFVLEIIQFFTDSFVQEEVKPRIAENQTDEPDGPPLNFVLSGQIVETDVFLLENPKSQETNAIVAKVSADVYCKVLGLSTMANVDVRPFELVYSQFPNTVATGRSLLRPCELKLLYRTPVKNGVGQDISLSFTQMQFSLSPSIMCTILQIMETAFGNQMKREDGAKEEDSNSDDFPWEEKPLSKDHLRGPVETRNTPAVAPYVSTGDQLDIRFQLLELVLGNDMKGMVVPLVTAKLSLRAKVTDWTSMLRVESDLCIEASYFNDTLGVWEPLLEPNFVNREVQPLELNFKLFTAEAQKMIFQADEDGTSRSRRKRVFSIDDDVDGPTAMASYIIINSMDTMQLTITPRVIDIIQELIKSWNMEALRKSKDTMLQSPLHIDNQLGVRTTVWVKPDAQVSGHDGKLLTIKKYAYMSPSDSKSRRVTDPGSRGIDQVDGGRRLFSYSGAGPTPAQLHSRQEKVDGPSEDEENIWYHCGDNKDCITILVHGFKPLRNINIHSAGRWLHPLMPEKSFFVSYIVCQIDVHLGRKTVLLRSPLQVVNSLPVPVQIWHIDVSSVDTATTAEIDEGDTTKIESGGTLCFPLDRIFETYFFIQPEGYERSTKFVTWRKLKDEERMFLQCVPANGSDSLPYHISVYASFDKFDKMPPEFVPKHIIELLPPLRVHNFLTSELVVNFKSGQKEYTQSCASGCITKVVHFQNGQEFDMDLEIRNYRERNWVGHSAVVFDEKRSTCLIQLKSMEDRENANLTVEVGKMFGKCLDLWIYSIFWLLNKTGIPLEVKVCGKREVYLQGANEETPLLVAHDVPSKAKVALRIKGGVWTKYFSLNAVGDESSVVCRDTTDKTYEIHINIQLSHTGTTKIITFSPKYLVTNKTKHELSYVEQNAKLQLWRMLAPDSCNPLWPQTKKQLMYLKAFGDTSTSQVFPFGHNNKSVLRLNDDITVNVQVSYAGSRIFIHVKDYEAGMAPVRVDNYSESTIEIMQKNVGTKKMINSLTSVTYTWDDLVKARILLWELPGSSTGLQTAEFSVDGWGRVKYKMGAPTQDMSDGDRENVTCVDICRSRCCSGKGKRTSESQRLLGTASPDPVDETDGVKRIYWVSHLDGKQRVLSFTDSLNLAKKLRKVGDEEELVMDVYVSLEGVGISMVDAVPKEILYISLASGTSVWEVETDPQVRHVLEPDVSLLLEEAWQNSEEAVAFEDKIEANLYDMEMEKPIKGRLIRTCDPAVWAQFSASANNVSVHVKLHRLQIDNQQYNVIYLTSLYPTPLSPRVIKRIGVKPFLEFSMITSSVADVTVIKYLKLLLQEFNLKIDKALLMGIIGFYYRDITEVDELTSYGEDCKILASTLQESIGNVTQSHSAAMVIEYFHLSPIKMHLAFSLQGGTVQDSPEGVMLEWLINTVGVHFTDVSDAEIKLAFFQRKSIRLSQDELLGDVIKHYELQAIKQFHVIVLGLDVLGNPYGLVTDIGHGFKDLFYEPYYGVVNGPHEFAEGLAYGVKSLLGHTIGGTFNAASKITDHLGQAVAALSFDSDYQKRRRAQMREDPSGIGEGLVMGGRNLVMGIVYGISGLFTKPVEGARRGGFEGFFKGIGKGLLGVLVKPTGGAIDLITSTFDGVRRFAEQSGEDNPCRMRLPRLTYPNQILEPYSKFKAEGFGLLKVIERGSDSLEFYKYHLFVVDDENSTGAVIILTDKRIIKAYKTRFFDEWKITWSDNYADIETVSRTENSVKITIKDDVLASPSDPDLIRIVNCATENQTEKFYTKLMTLSHDCQSHLL